MHSSEPLQTASLSFLGNFLQQSILGGISYKIFFLVKEYLIIDCLKISLFVCACAGRGVRVCLCEEFVVWHRLYQQHSFLSYLCPLHPSLCFRCVAELRHFLCRLPTETVFKHRPDLWLSICFEDVNGFFSVSQPVAWLTAFFFLIGKSFWSGSQA